MAPRGMSKEEKRIKMLEIFHESADFFSFKEIEKIASKQKGIVLPSVKEVLEEVKSDGLVTSEKIGTGVYYWSFPSAAGAQKQAVVDRIAKEIADIDAKIAESAAALKQANKGREDTAERQKLLQELKDEQAMADTMVAELAAFGAADPLKYEKKRAAVEVAKRAVARWNDNIHVCFGVLKNVGAEEETLRAMFNLPEEWDDLETIGK